MSDIDPKILALIVVILGGLVSYLLRQKDAQQEEKLKILFRLCDELQKTTAEDMRALQELRIHIAEGHYKKSELDSKFERLEYAFRDGLTTLGAKFDKLTDTLLNHISKEDSK